MDAEKWTTSIHDDPPAGVTLCAACEKVGGINYACRLCKGAALKVDWEQVERELGEEK